jgi:trimeric autotransporter adhesin
MKKTIVLISLYVLAVVGCAPYHIVKIHRGQTKAALSDTCDQKTWATNGAVYTIVPVGDKIYIGGDFTQVGPYTGGGVPLNSSTGLPTAAFPKINGTVNAVCTDGNGGWFVGGSFLSVDGITQRNIAHILSGGNLDPAWNLNTMNTNGDIRSIVKNGATVYVGGSFTSIGGQRRSCIAALDATSGNVLAWDPNAAVDSASEIRLRGGAVISLAVSGTTVYAGGGFTSIGGQNRKNIAAVDVTTGNVLAWDPQSNKIVFSLAVNESGTTVYAGGNFDTIGGLARQSIAALDAKTGNATAWNPNPGKSTYGEPDVYSLLVKGTTVYVGGCFITIGGQYRNSIAALDAATGNATSWNPGALSCICAMAMKGTTIYAGGFFTTIGGQNRNYIAAIDAAAGNVLAWNPNANGYVQSLAANETTVYAGGRFTFMGGQSRNHVAALDATTGAATAWNPNADSAVYSLAVNRTTVYAGGKFTTIGGQERNHVAALNATTGNATLWNPNADSSVQQLVVNGTTVYAGGYAKGKFAGLDKNGRIRMATLGWDPNADGPITSLIRNKAQLFVGGRFHNIGGQRRNYIAALDAVTGEVLAWNPGPNNQVYSLAVNGTTVYVGGAFTGIGQSIAHPYFAQFKIH